MIQCTCTDTTGYRTLAQMRTDLLALLGYAAVSANPPPGMNLYLNTQLRLAHDLLFRRFPAIRTTRWFTWRLTAGERFYDLVANVESAELATPGGPTLSTATTGGTLAAGTYTYTITRVNANGETLASAPVSITTTGSTSTVTLTFPAALTAPTNGASAQTQWKVYGRSGTRGLLATVAVASTTYTDTGEAVAGAVEPTSNTTDECSKPLDPYSLEWVGVEQDNGRYRLRNGVPSGALSYDLQGWPTHYEVRQCIELWPAPEATEGTLLVKGRFKATQFTADADTPGVPDDMVFLLALANAKSHYRHPDANNYVQQMETLLDNLVAGTHATAAYVPGQDREDDLVYVQPRPTVPFA